MEFLEDIQSCLRNEKISTAEIHWIFWRLEFEPDAEIEHISADFERKCSAKASQGYLVSKRKPGFFVKPKEDQNLNHRNTLDILRIIFFIWRRNWGKRQFFIQTLFYMF